MNIALKLVEFHSEADLEILKLAVIFHDISYEQYETHVEESIKVAGKFLNEQNYHEDKIKKVLQVMISHSSPHRRRLGVWRGGYCVPVLHLKYNRVPQV